jgi:hypothetical protein
MKIEIMIAELTEKGSGMSCFEASKHIRDQINDCKTIQGIIIINDKPIKFSFSSYFMDGDIFTTCTHEELVIVKYMIPLYVYNNIDKFKKVYNNNK